MNLLRQAIEAVSIDLFEMKKTNGTVLWFRDKRRFKKAISTKLEALLIVNLT